MAITSRFTNEFSNTQLIDQMSLGVPGELTESDFCFGCAALFVYETVLLCGPDDIELTCLASDLHDSRHAPNHHAQLLNG